MSKLTYKVFNIKTQKYEDDVIVDQDGDFLKVIDGWGCEGGGGPHYLNSEDYEVH